jgi:hypothetical protein
MALTFAQSSALPQCLFDRWHGGGEVAEVFRALSDSSGFVTMGPLASDPIGYYTSLTESLVDLFAGLFHWTFGIDRVFDAFDRFINAFTRLFGSALWLARNK